MSAVSERVVLCEGYYDRAFWKGWLLHLGCTDPGLPGKGRSSRRTVSDPWGKPVKGGGVYGFHSQSRRFVRVVPCGGKDHVLEEAITTLRARTEGEVEHLVVNVDADADAGASEDEGPALKRSTMLDRIRQEIDSAAVFTETRDILLPARKCTVFLVTWKCADPPTPQLPAVTTLERLASAALIAVHPTRGLSVSAWLASRGPDAPPARGKEHAWSHMAGWYAERGCEAFYETLWTDATIAAALRARLEAGGDWRVGRTLAY